MVPISLDFCHPRPVDGYLRTYKPDPRAYRMAVDAFGVRREGIAYFAFAGWVAGGVEVVRLHDLLGQPYDVTGGVPGRRTRRDGTGLDRARGLPASERPGGLEGGAGRTMNQERALAFAEAWVDAWNRHDLERVLAHYAEDIE